MTCEADHPTGSAAAAVSSFEELLAPLLNRAFGAAQQMARKREDAEDLVQDATLCAFRAFDSFRMEPNFKAWFFGILTNCFISKQRSRRVAVSMDEVGDPPQLFLFQKSREGGRLPEGPDSA